MWQPDWPGNIDMEREFRVVRECLDALSSFSRLIVHDHRGVGLSSRNVTVKDLVAGSGFAFEDAGEHELKGVPDRWHVYRVVRG